MEIQEKINLAKRNIRQAIEDYGAHSWQTAVLKDIDARFVDRLAEDNAYAKDELRSLFRKSPVWDEALDALVINGTRTHNPDYDVVYQLGDALLKPAREKADFEEWEKLGRAMQFFIGSQEDKASGIAAIQELSPMPTPRTRSPAGYSRHCAKSWESPMNLREASSRGSTPSLRMSFPPRRSVSSFMCP